jgi:hypothetical protein
MIQTRQSVVLECQERAPSVQQLCWAGGQPAQESEEEAVVEEYCLQYCGSDMTESAGNITLTIIRVSLKSYEQHRRWGEAQLRK